MNTMTRSFGPTSGQSKEANYLLPRLWSPAAKFLSQTECDPKSQREQEEPGMIAWR